MKYLDLPKVIMMKKIKKMITIILKIIIIKLMTCYLMSLEDKLKMRKRKEKRKAKKICLNSMRLMNQNKEIILLIKILI